MKKPKEKTQAKVFTRALLKHGMNATAAAQELRPGLKDESARRAGYRLLQSESVQEELEKQLAPLGLDEKSRDKYLNELWKWFLSNDKLLKTTAARILGRGFIRDTNVQQPVELKITGFEEGIKHMLGEEKDTSNSEEERDESKNTSHPSA